MVFSSATFLFFFLPAVFAAERLAPSIRGKNCLLCIASLLFYAFGNLGWLPILLLSVCCNYAAGLLVSRPGRTGKTALAAALVVNLAVLSLYKYLDFFLSIVNSLTGMSLPMTELTLPVGISFFTFQGMSYVIDVYRDPAQCSRSFGNVLLYIAFFPQLVAGPIIKYQDIAQQLTHRSDTPQETTLGIRRFVLGLSKKLLLANALGQGADGVYALGLAQLDARLAWLGAVCYTLQIYFDFSGYSDMAIGLARMFGFRFKENFDHPYISGSIKDFWRRWHISLSSWFRDYLYIPLGGNRRGPVRARANRLAVFFFTGLWHGANWTFICWGLWHGLLLMIEDRFRLPQRLPRWVGHLYTMAAVTLGFMLFRADNLAQAGAFLQAMFTDFSCSQEGTALFWNLFSPRLALALGAGVLCAMPLLAWLDRRLSRRGKALGEGMRNGVCLAFFLLDGLVLAASSFNPFIYFQF